MVPNYPIDGLIIHIYLQELLNKVFKHGDNYPIKYCVCILQPKRHDCILKTTPFNDKHGLMTILLCNSDLVVPRKAICKGIHILIAYSFKDLICKMSRERIMHSCIVQIS